jgi:hypothetical protein
MGHVRSVFEEVSLMRVFKSGCEGATMGSRFGGRGRAVGFVIAAGVSIFHEVSGVDVTDIASPDPEKVATSMDDWREAGAETNDERVEWLSAATGVAVELAAQSSTDESVQTLTQVDPGTAIGTLQTAAELTDPNVELPAFGAEFEALPDVRQLRQPVAQLTAVTAELLESDFVQELSTDHET